MANARDGSTADIATGQLNVRFAPESGHWKWQLGDIRRDPPRLISRE
jgi:hypothetical protein